MSNSTLCIFCGKWKGHCNTAVVNSFREHCSSQRGQLGQYKPEPSIFELTFYPDTEGPKVLQFCLSPQQTIYRGSFNRAGSQFTSLPACVRVLSVAQGFCEINILGLNPGPESFPKRLQLIIVKGGWKLAPNNSNYPTVQDYCSSTSAHLLTVMQIMMQIDAAMKLFRVGRARWASQNATAQNLVLLPLLRATRAGKALT